MRDSTSVSPARLWPSSLRAGCAGALACILLGVALSLCGCTAPGTPEAAVEVEGTLGLGATPTPLPSDSRVPVDEAGGGQPTGQTQPTPTATPAHRLSLSPGALDPLDPVEQARIEQGPNYRPVRPSIFDRAVMVGFYGTPAGRGLGILGTASPTDTLVMVAAQAFAYRVLLTDTQVIPFFHMVTTIADKLPGDDGNSNHRVLTSTVQLWVDIARANGFLSVLDIQPAHSPITAELAYVEPFVHQRGVHLAVDPEFAMPDAASIPGARIGVMDGATVNLVQAWLDRIAMAVGERKILVIHQFDDRMITGKELIQDYPMVDLVWDSDGFGGPYAKAADYRQYATEPGFEYGGFKLFYDYDVPVMSPAEVMGMEPRPVFVVYQ